MPSHSQEVILVTGASGHVGKAVCEQLRLSGEKFVASDIRGENMPPEFVPCDLTEGEPVRSLFQRGAIRVVIHLAAVLPSAYHAEPLAGAAINLVGSLNLLREAVVHRVRRFVFASSVSVYGLTGKCSRPMKEEDPAAPDEAYGASKRAIEVIGENLHEAGKVEFVALRLARVIGPGIEKTSSPWRAQILEKPSADTPISIPFAPDAEICFLHVEDAARMLLTLAGAPVVRHRIYNAPAEIREARQLKALIEERHAVAVELGPEGVYAGATCDGSRFAREFRFQASSLQERLAQARSPTR